MEEEEIRVTFILIFIKNRFFIRLKIFDIFFSSSIFTRCRLWATCEQVRVTIIFSFIVVDSIDCDKFCELTGNWIWISISISVWIWFYFEYIFYSSLVCVFSCKQRWKSNFSSCASIDMWIKRAASSVRWNWMSTHFSLENATNIKMKLCEVVFSRIELAQSPKCIKISWNLCEKRVKTVSNFPSAQKKKVQRTFKRSRIIATNSVLHTIV